MKRIMFVCYGNICRSPMAEFIMKDLVKNKGKEKEFFISSAATSTEEIGNPVHRGTRAILDGLNIDYSQKRAVRLQFSDYEKYDYFIGMDEQNLRDMKRMLGGDPDGKVRLLLDFTPSPKDVADPYWTRNFDQTYDDVVRGTKALYDFLIKD